MLKSFDVFIIWCIIRFSISRILHQSGRFEVFVIRNQKIDVTKDPFANVSVKPVEQISRSFQKHRIDLVWVQHADDLVKLFQNLCIPGHIQRINFLQMA